MANRVWQHPVFGSIKPSMRRNKQAQATYDKFLKDKEYVSFTGLFAQYCFMRCLQDGIPCKIEILYGDIGQYFRVSME